MTSTLVLGLLDKFGKLRVASSRRLREGTVKRCGRQVVRVSRETVRIVKQLPQLYAD